MPSNMWAYRPSPEDERLAERLKHLYPTRADLIRAGIQQVAIQTVENLEKREAELKEELRDVSRRIAKVRQMSLSFLRASGAPRADTRIEVVIGRFMRALEAAESSAKGVITPAGTTITRDESFWVRMESPIAELKASLPGLRHYDPDELVRRVRDGTIFDKMLGDIP